MTFSLDTLCLLAIAVALWVAVLFGTNITS